MNTFRDGQEVHRLIRQHDPDTRTIVITGLSSETGDLVQLVFNEGANAVCYKPFDVAALLDTVARLSKPAD